MSTREQLQTAEATLDRLLEWISRSDTKFAVVLGVDTGMLGVLSGFSPALGTLSVGAIVSAIVSVSLLVSSLVCIYFGTYPRTKGPNRSLIYFGSIAGKSQEEIKETFRARSAEDHLEDVLEQIHRNSEILDRKFKHLKWSYRTLLAAVVPWAITLYLFGTLLPPFA